MNSVVLLLAANLPSWVLLQSRGYLVSYLLYGVVALSFVVVLVCHTSLDTIPIFIVYSKSAGGYIFPLLFVTIACGAVSGFHSLVSSGTLSKTVKNESPDIKRVGYCAMLIEGLFAVIVICVAAIAKQAGSEAKKTLGAICATLTTVIPGHVLSSATYNGAAAYNVIWPIFGSANQLLASVALLAVTSWLVQTVKNKSTALYTGIPTIFMFGVTLSALILSIVSYLTNLTTALASGNPIVPYMILIVIAVLLIILAVSLIITSCKVLFYKPKMKKAIA